MVLAPNKNPVALDNKITELAVRLNVTEEQNRLLREENQRLQQIELAHQKLKSEHQQTVERKVLLDGLALVGPGWATNGYVSAR